MAIDDCIRLAAALEHNARNVPCAAGLQPNLETWQAECSQLGFEFTTCPFGFQGTIAGHPVRVVAIRTEPHQYRCELRMEFAPLLIDLWVVPKPWSEQTRFDTRSVPVKLGDRAFRNAYAVRSSVPDRCEPLLTPPIQHRLLALRQRLPVLVLDDHVAVLLSSVPNSPRDLPAMLAELGPLVSDLTRAAAGHA